MAMTKLKRNQFIPFIDVAKDLTFAASEWARVDYSTIFELTVGEQEETLAYICYENDARYDGAEIRKGTIYAKYRQFIENCFRICPRQALHARQLGFIHPGNGKHLVFESPLPEDMRQLIDKWRKYSSNMSEWVAGED